MKKRAIFWILMAMASGAAITSFIGPKPAHQAEKTPGVFVGTSPCDNSIKTNLAIKEKCDYIKWKLDLKCEPVTKMPSTYVLTVKYGFYVDNRTSKITGEDSLAGRWTTVKGTKHDAAATVYKLNRATSQPSIFFFKADENLLHLLDDSKGLMVGNGGQSYTLSRLPQ